MDKNSKEENIRAELQKILKLIYQAQESYKILRCLWTKSNDEVIDGLKCRSYFLLYCKERFFKDTVIELAKLFNAKDTEHFNLRAFKNRLYKDENFNNVIPKEILKNWSKMLKDVDSIIINIVENRNGYVAHTDRDFKPEDFPLSLADLNSVICIAQKIAKDIHLILDGASFLIESPIGSPVQNLEHILDELSEREKYRLRPYLLNALNHGLNEELPTWFIDEQKDSSPC